MLSVLSSTGADTKPVTDLFTFWRPRFTTSGRKSQLLTLTDRQLDAMYALAGGLIGRRGELRGGMQGG